MEIPQLLDTCIRSDLYEEALDLIQFMQHVQTAYAYKNSQVIRILDKEVAQSTIVFRENLFQKLRGKLSLPQCLQCVTVLRRLDSITRYDETHKILDYDAYIQREFLSCRHAFLNANVQKFASTSTMQPYDRIIRTIDVERSILFDIITQYESIFGAQINVDDEAGGVGQKKERDSDLLLCSLITQILIKFMSILQQNFPLVEDLSSSVTIIEQSMFLASSLGRFGVDFRATLVMFFQSFVLQSMDADWGGIVQEFQSKIDSYADPTAPSTATPLMIVSLRKQLMQDRNPDGEHLTPPKSLMAFPVLAETLNMFLESFNDLRYDILS